MSCSSNILSKMHIKIQIHLARFVCSPVCSCLLGSGLRLKATGLSDSVLSRLPFIAGMLYLADPLYGRVHSHTCTYTYKNTGGRLLLLCLAWSHFIISAAFVVMHWRFRYCQSGCRKMVSDYKSL